MKSERTNPVYSSFIPVLVEPFFNEKCGSQQMQSIIIMILLSLGKALMHIQDNKKQICITETTDTLKIVICKMFGRTWETFFPLENECKEYKGTSYIQFEVYRRPMPCACLFQLEKKSKFYYFHVNNITLLQAYSLSGTLGCKTITHKTEELQDTTNHPTYI